MEFISQHKEGGKKSAIALFNDPVTWYGINYAGTQVTEWDFQNVGTRTSPARLSFIFKVPLCNLRPSISTEFRTM